MRNPKTFLLLSVIVGVLLLGVAYAAIQNITLTINGTVTATPDQANFKVKFTGTPTSTVSGHGKAETLRITGDTSATMHISNMTTLGDTVTAKFTVINESIDITAYLASSVTHRNTEYFEVTTTLATTELAPQNKTTTLSVVVKLIKTPIKEQTDAIDIYLVASPTEMSGELVSFKIDGEEYVVVEGTTWATWFENNGWHKWIYPCVFQGYDDPYIKGEFWGWEEATILVLDTSKYDTPIESGEYYTTQVHS